MSKNCLIHNEHEEKRPRWLRSRDVREMLGISDSTLQTLRINGTIPAYRLGSSWFYKEAEIILALESNRLHNEGRDE
jgi:hypothetical protein